MTFATYYALTVPPEQRNWRTRGLAMMAYRKWMDRVSLYGEGELR